MKHTFAGDGPGVQTPDGCSVELYRALPYLGELEEIIHLFEPGTSVLELGCGTGRLCLRLRGVGCSVTGVDESEAMLAQVPSEVRTIRGKVEDLDAGESFDAVLLASHLINHPDQDARAAFVRCARRHLRPGGILFIKRHSVAWLTSVAVGPAGRAGDTSLFVESVEREAGVVSMCLRYELGGQSWRHFFSTAPLSEEAVDELLLQHGIGPARWLGKHRTWGVAVAGDA